MARTERDVRCTDGTSNIHIKIEFLCVSKKSAYTNSEITATASTLEGRAGLAPFHSSIGKESPHRCWHVPSWDLHEHGIIEIAHVCNITPDPTKCMSAIAAQSHCLDYPIIRVITHLVSGIRHLHWLVNTQRLLKANNKCVHVYIKLSITSSRIMRFAHLCLQPYVPNN